MDDVLLLALEALDRRSLGRVRTVCRSWRGAADRILRERARIRVHLAAQFRQSESGSSSSSTDITLRIDDVLVLDGANLAYRLVPDTLLFDSAHKEVSWVSVPWNIFDSSSSQWRWAFSSTSAAEKGGKERTTTRRTESEFESFTVNGSNGTKRWILVSDDVLVHCSAPVAHHERTQFFVFEVVVAEHVLNGSCERRAASIRRNVDAKWLPLRDRASEVMRADKTGLRISDFRLDARDGVSTEAYDSARSIEELEHWRPEVHAPFSSRVEDGVDALVCKSLKWVNPVANYAVADLISVPCGGREREWAVHTLAETLYTRVHVATFFNEAFDELALLFANRARSGEGGMTLASTADGAVFAPRARAFLSRVFAMPVHALFLAMTGYAGEFDEMAAIRHLIEFRKTASHESVAGYKRALAELLL